MLTSKEDALNSLTKIVREAKEEEITKKEFEYGISFLLKTFIGKESGVSIVDLTTTELKSEQNKVKGIGSIAFVELIQILEESDRLKYRPFSDTAGEVSDRAKLVESYIRDFKLHEEDRGAQ